MNYVAFMNEINNFQVANYVAPMNYVGITFANRVT